MAQISGGIILSSYGLLILSFVSGTHWGYLIREEGAELSKTRFALLQSSNVIALCAWGAYMFTSKAEMFLIFAVLFAALLAVDYVLKRKGVISAEYFSMRRNITLIVCVSLIAAASVPLIYRIF